MFSSTTTNSRIVNYLMSQTAKMCNKKLSHLAEGKQFSKSADWAMPARGSDCVGNSTFPNPPAQTNLHTYRREKGR